MARRMTAIRLYDEITTRFEEAPDFDDESKTTIAEFKEWLVLASFEDQREAASRKQDIDANRGKGDETETPAGPEPDDDDGDDNELFEEK